MPLPSVSPNVYSALHDLLWSSRRTKSNLADLTLQSPACFHWWCLVLNLESHKRSASILPPRQTHTHSSTTPPPPAPRLSAGCGMPLLPVLSGTGSPVDLSLRPTLSPVRTTLMVRVPEALELQLPSYRYSWAALVGCWESNSGLCKNYIHSLNC